MFVLIGIFSFHLRLAFIEDVFLEEKAFVKLTGTVEEVDFLSNGYRVVLSDLAFDRASYNLKKVRIAFRHKPKESAPNFGDVISTSAILRPPPKPVSPDGFDLKKYIRFQEIGAVGFSVSEYQLIEQKNGFWIENLRLKLIENIRRQSHGIEGEVLIALLTGERGGIDPHVLQNIRAAGLAHLLSISGLHLGLVAGFLFFVFRCFMSTSSFIALNFEIKKWAAFFAWIGIGFYLLLAGAPVPAGRAYIMTSFVLFAVILDRTAISLRVVSLAAISLMLVRPEYVFQVGFHLSFIAVTSLISFYEYYKNASKNASRHLGVLQSAKKYFAATALTSFIATCATAPYTAYYFGYLSTYSILSNLIAVPLMALWVMPLAFLSVLFWPLSFSSFFISLAAFGIGIILEVSEYISALPLSVMQVLKFDFSLLVFMVFGLYWLFIWKTKWRLFGGVVTLFAILLSFFSTTPDIWVDPEAKIIAIKDVDNTLLVSSLRRGKFAVDVWRKEAAIDAQNIVLWPEIGASQSGNMQCDRQGCVFRKSGMVVAFPRTKMALLKDCQRANYVIATFRVPQGVCHVSHRVIDRRYILRNGAQAIVLK